MKAELFVQSGDDEETERLKNLGLPIKVKTKDFYFRESSIAAIYEYSEEEEKFMVLIIGGIDYHCVFDYEVYAYLKAELYGG